MRKTRNPWASKAKALDRYRWTLLRQRHGRIGSGLRFFRDAVKDSIFGWLARFRLGSSISPLACDFLLLQSTPKVVELKRKRLLIKELQKRGYCLIETALDTPRSLLSKRQFYHPGNYVPVRYFGYAAHAKWLVEYYRPRVLINDRNGSIFVPFIKLALEFSEGKLVHLAHATTLDHSQRLSMNDYHYYFLFGQSSLEALRQKKLLFGTSMAVLAGSHMIDESYRLPTPDIGKKTLLVLGVGPEREKLDSYLQSYALLRDWAVANTDYQVLIKAHPRSTAKYWTQYAIKNIRVLPPNVTLADALAEASIVINILSNAIIEAGLSGRPIVRVNCGHSEDVFGESNFFGSSIKTADSLSRAIEEIENNYAVYCQQSFSFSQYHLEHGAEGLKNSVQALEDILKGKLPEMRCEQLVESSI